MVYHTPLRTTQQRRSSARRILPVGTLRFGHENDTLSYMKPDLVANILELPVADRVRLVEVIWDSIAVAPVGLPLTQWQRQELDRRLEAYLSDPDSGSTLEESQLFQISGR